MKKKYEKPILQELKISGLRGEEITPLSFCYSGITASGRCPEGGSPSEGVDCLEGTGASVDCVNGSAVSGCTAGSV